VTNTQVLSPIVERYVIPIVVAVSISLISGLITYLQLFVLAPDFQVTLGTYSEPAKQHENLTITNIGKAQAKNANIVVESHDPLTLVGRRCFEGNFKTISPGNSFRVEFDRLSTNVHCQISFDSSANQGIQRVIITADNMAGFEYFPRGQDQRMQANTTAVTNVNGTTSGSTEVTFTTEDKELKVVYCIILISFVVSLAALLLVFYIRHRRKQRKIREKETERKNELTEREKELRSELTHLRHLSALYSRNIKSSTDGNFVNALEVESFSQLQKQITSLETELEEIQSELGAPNLHEPIGKFFSEWGPFELQLQTLAERSKIDISQRSNIYKMAKELQSSKKTTTRLCWQTK
jgi:hypothetical protein